MAVRSRGGATATLRERHRVKQCRLRPTLSVSFAAERDPSRPVARMVCRANHHRNGHWARTQHRKGHVGRASHGRPANPQPPHCRDGECSPAHSRRFNLVFVSRANHRWCDDARQAIPYQAGTTGTTSSARCLGRPRPLTAGIRFGVMVLRSPEEPRGSCPSSGVKGFGRRFPRRPASLREGTHVRVEEDIACAAVAGRN